MCWKKWLGVAALAGGGSLAGGAAYVSALPVQVALASSSCVETEQAPAYGFMAKDKLPCHFAAYHFRSRAGWVVLGASGNVRGQCFLLPASAINARTSRRDWGTAPKWHLTDACYASYAVYRPEKTRGWSLRWLWSSFR